MMPRFGSTPWPRWRSLLVAGIAVVPLYGYRVHAARDDQVVALVLILCWFVTCAVALGMVAAAALRPPADLGRRQRLRRTSAALAVAALIGYGGVRAAFFELLAG